MSNKQNIINSLRERIGALEWSCDDEEITSFPLGIPAIDNSLPHGGITAGACHDVIGENAALGFIVQLLSSMIKNGPVMWCSPNADFYTPGFARFGVGDTDVIFVETSHQQHALWSAETALRCKKISGIVLETKSLSLSAARRLKLLAQEHLTTAIFWFAKPPLNPTSAASRWHIDYAPAPGLPSRNGINTVGAQRLSIQLMRNLHGQAPLSWTVEFDEHALRFRVVSSLLPSIQQDQAPTAVVGARQRISQHALGE